MKINLINKFLTALLVVLIAVFLWDKSGGGNATAQSGANGRYELHAGEVFSILPGNDVQRRPMTFKIDTQTGQSWVLNPSANSWVKINN